MSNYKYCTKIYFLQEVAMDTHIFLSYSWDDSELADKIDGELSSYGFDVKRDIRDIGSWKSIKEFMSSIRNQDYAVIIISSNYLKSPNCMYEVMELLKDSQYKDKVLSIVTKDADIYNPISRANYIKYWEEETRKLEEAIKHLKIENTTELTRELRKYRSIETTIASFLDLVSDKNNPQVINAVEKIIEKINTNSPVASSTVKKKTKENLKIKLETYHYAATLFNAAVKMSTADDKLKIANQIKDEILSKYDTAEIAEIYAMTLGNATVQMSTADDKLKIANQIKNEILIKYDTSEIALQYARALSNATVKIFKADDILKIANQIKAEILSEYGTAEIALKYARALLRATNQMSNADDILKIANQIKAEILSEYGTAEIALHYAKALFNTTTEMSNADDIVKIANQIKIEILSEYGTAEIALRYEKALVTATDEMSNADNILKIANQIKDEILNKYDTPEIVEQYKMALRNAITKI